MWPVWRKRPAPVPRRHPLALALVRCNQFNNNNLCRQSHRQQQTGTVIERLFIVRKKINNIMILADG
jgi:hypothetical protein